MLTKRKLGIENLSKFYCGRCFYSTDFKLFNFKVKSKFLSRSRQSTHLSIGVNYKFKFKINNLCKIFNYQLKSFLSTRKKKLWRLNFYQQYIHADCLIGNRYISTFVCELLLSINKQFLVYLVKYLRSIDCYTSPSE